MTRDVNVEQTLRGWMDERASMAAPADLLAAVVSETATVSQRRWWLPRLELPPIAVVPARLAWLGLVLLLVGAMAGTLLVGASPTHGPTVENGLIAFVGSATPGASWTDDPAAFDIYAVNPDGSTRVRFTDTTAMEWSPVWSPDGTRLAFIRQLDAGGPPPEGQDCDADPAACERGTPGEYAIVLSSPRPGSEEVVFESRGAINTLGWSPDSRQLSFVHDASGGLVVLDLTAGTTRLILPGSGHEMAWSPDGTSLIATGPSEGTGSDLYRAFVDGRPAVRLTSDPGYESAPTWSPDGTRIAFDVDPDGRGTTTRIEVLTIDGGQRSRLADDARGAAWSPDGALIAFIRTSGDPSGRSNAVWVVGPDGTGERTLTDHGYRVDWSPDGSLLLVTGPIGASTVTRDGSTSIRLPIDDAAPLGIDWQPLPR